MSLFVNKNRLPMLLLSAATTILALSVSKFQFTPACEDAVATAIISFLLALFAWVVFILIRRNSSIVLSQQWELLVAVAAMLATLFLMLANGAPLTSLSLVEEVKTPNRGTFYLYEGSCFPDARATCASYRNEIRFGAWWSPVTKTIFTCNCIVSGPVVKGGFLEFFTEEKPAFEKRLQKIQIVD